MTGPRPLSGRRDALQTPAPRIARDLPRDFVDTLDAVAACLNATGTEWSVFGGAAYALHGFGEGPVKDIDILLPVATAAQLRTRLGAANHADGTSPRFRSDYRLRPDFGPVEVELIAGFKVRDAAQGWQDVTPGACTQMRPGTQPVFVATKARLAELFRLCGRPKDLRRAALLA